MCPLLLSSRMMVLVSEFVDAKMRRPLPAAVPGIEGVDVPSAISRLREKRQEADRLGGELEKLHELLTDQVADLGRRHDEVLKRIEDGSSNESVLAAVAALRAAGDQHKAAVDSHKRLRRQMHSAIHDLRQTYRWLVEHG